MPDYSAIPYPPSVSGPRFGGYAPAQSYRGDIYLDQGIAGLGQGIGQAIQNYQRNRAAHEQRDAVMNFLVENYPSTLPADLKTTGGGETQPSFDALDRYHAANENQKNKWMLQAYTAYTDKIRQQKMLEETARANLYNAQASALGELGPPQVTWSDGVAFARTSPRQWQQIQYGNQPPANPQTAVTQDPNDPNKKILWYYNGNAWVPAHQPGPSLMEQLAPFLGAGGIPGAAPPGAQPGADTGTAPTAPPTTPPPSATAVPSVAPSASPYPSVPAVAGGSTPIPPTQQIDNASAQGFIRQAQMQMPDETDRLVIFARAKQLARNAGYIWQ